VQQRRSAAQPLARQRSKPRRRFRNPETHRH